MIDAGALVLHRQLSAGGALPFWYGRDDHGDTPPCRVPQSLRHLATLPQSLACTDSPMVSIVISSLRTGACLKQRHSYIQRP